MARYRKVDPRFWKDEKVRHLSLIDKLICLYVFTGQSNRIGLFSFSPGEAIEDLGLSRQTFAKGFGNVTGTLSLGWDPEARVLYLPTWWKYNTPENPNNLIGNLKDLDDVPDSPLIERFINNLKYLSETLHQTFTQTLAKRYPQGCPKRSPTQEQEQELKQEQEEEKRSQAASDKNRSLSVEDLVTLYNDLTPSECPSVKVLSAARRDKARKFLKMFSDEKFWRESFQQVGISKFLRGLKNGADHQHFVFDFDWMLTRGKDGSENIVKVHDGKYV